jgi:tight adherence protein B
VHFELNDYAMVLAVFVLSLQLCLALLPNLLSGEKVGDPAYMKFIVESGESMFIKISKKRARFIIWGTTFAVSSSFFLVFSIFNQTFAIVMAVFGAVIGRMTPRWALTIMHKKRTKKFNLQMVDALTLLSNALKSGLSVAQGLENAGKQMPNPISQEFNLVLSEQRVGVSMEEAFINLGKRVKCEDVDMFVTSVIILKETGGDLSETFDTIVSTIRDRIKVEQKISALVSQGIMQGLIIFLMPFALGLAFYMIDPNHILPMFSSFIGWALISAMLFLQFIGGAVMWKIVRIEV